LEPAGAEDEHILRELIGKHLHYTRSPKAEWVLDNWESMLPKFVKVFPHEYRRVLEQQKSLEAVAGG
jgi:glutamate synthase (NADPH) large chain